MSNPDELPTKVVLKSYYEGMTGVTGGGGGVRCSKRALNTYPNVHLKKKFDFRKMSLNKSLPNPISSSFVKSQEG